MLRWTRLAVASLTLIALSGTAYAQGGGGAQGGAGGGGQGGGRGFGPARDQTDQQAGTAVLRGRVITADSGTPVRRAQVRATAAGVRGARLVTTDAQGRFELKDLPAGRWNLSASKAGLVTLSYGQSRPTESSKPVEVRDGQVVDKLDIPLPRGSAVTGRVFDEFGDPIAGARVQVMRLQMVQGVRRLVAGGAADQTDDTGAFRLFGLSPGDYFVSATLRIGNGGGGPGGFGPGADITDGASYAPTYYPGTGSLGDAQRITLGVGQEQGNVNFALLPVRTVRISGTALDSAGNGLGGGLITLTNAGEAALAFGGPATVSRVRPDGTFTLVNVAPGSYTLTANSGGAGGGFGGRGGGARGGAGGGAGGALPDPELAAIPLNVGSDDLTGLTVVTAKGAALSGSLVAAEGSTGELRTNGLQVTAQPARPDAAVIGQRNARVQDDGTFQVTGLLGDRYVRVTGLPAQWMLKSIVLDGMDVTDTPIPFAGSTPVTGLQIVVTDRVTQVTGRVLQRGQPVKDYSVVVFADDATKWAFPSRFIASGRADDNGQFSVKALPPAERYLAVAVDALENGEATDPEFLARLRDRGTPFTLADGESKALDLTLVQR